MQKYTEGETIFEGDTGKIFYLTSSQIKPGIMAQNLFQDRPLWIIVRLKINVQFPYTGKNL